MSNLTRPSLFPLSASGVLALGLAAAPLPAAEITLPAETARFAESPLPGYALATAMCQTCHSADYTHMQPTNLPRTYWKSAVVKMQKTFGAPLPDDSIEPITDYLVKTYGAERPGAASAPSNPPPPPAKSR